jgi:hypothetical protein
VRIAVTIFLMTLLASSQTPAGQLLKIPFMVAHYLKHQEQGAMSPLNFLYQHYSSEHSDDDLPEDQQLPFKTTTYCALGFAIIPWLWSTDLVHSLPVGLQNIFEGDYHPRQHLVNIFHPPQV